MNYKRKSNKKNLARKMFRFNKVDTWSRMIHKWWLKDNTKKLEFKNELTR